MGKHDQFSLIHLSVNYTKWLNTFKQLFQFLKNQTGQNTYHPNAELTDAKKLRTNFKRDAKNTDVATNNIIQQSLEATNEPILAKIPKLETARLDV